MKKQTNPNDLTDDEIAFLRGTNVPPEVKGYLARQHENIGTKTTAYRKVAAAAQAECEALMATINLSRMHGELADLEEAKRRLATAEGRGRALEATAKAKDAEIRRLTAGPAAAVHSDD